MPDQPSRSSVPTLADLRQAPGSAVVVSLVLLVAALAGTGALARGHHEARTARAAAHFRAGEQALARGDTQRAVVELRAAVALDRDRAAYGLPLARALLEAGSAGEALTYLDPALRADPTSGEANVLRARIAQALGDDDTALVHYQRALFGSWPAPAGRLAAADALVVLALTAGRPAQARAALAQIAVDVPQAAPAQRHFANQLRAAGEPDDARAAYTRAVELDPRDAPSWVALAELAVAAGDFRAAQRHAAGALAAAPDAPEGARLSALSTQVLALDPEVPRLSAAQRLRRERALLQAVDEAVDACPAAANAPGASQARADAAALLERRPAAFEPAAARALAEQLWQARLAGCPQMAAAFEPLAIVMRRLGEGETR